MCVCVCEGEKVCVSGYVDVLVGRWLWGWVLMLVSVYVGVCECISLCLSECHCAWVNGEVRSSVCVCV